MFADSGFQTPFGLAFDRDGNLYVSNVDSDTIEKFAPDGSDLGVFASTRLNEPFGIMFDPAGNLYVANRGNDTIEKFIDRGRSRRLRLYSTEAALHNDVQGQTTCTSIMKHLKVLARTESLMVEPLHLSENFFVLYFVEYAQNSLRESLSEIRTQVSPGRSQTG